MINRHQKKRIDQMQLAFGSRERWETTGEIEYYGGGRTCGACGRTIKHAITLTRVGGITAGIQQFLGRRCAITALGWLTGGLQKK